MTPHSNRYGAEEPPLGFADRVVEAMLAERRPSPRASSVGLKRFSFLALAAVFMGASAWAAYRAAGRTAIAPPPPPTDIAPAPTPVVAAPVEAEKPPAVAPPSAPAPEEPAPPPPRPPRQPRIPVSAPATSSAQPSASVPRLIHVPRCACTAGIELCACVE